MHRPLRSKYTVWVVAAIIVATPVCVLATKLKLDDLRYESWREDATKVKAGDSAGTVLSRMGGSPIIIFGLGKGGIFDVAVETWVYGKEMTVKAPFITLPPFFWPYRFRLAPQADDIQIKFDERGRVKEVIVPELNP